MTLKAELSSHMMKYPCFCDILLICSVGPMNTMKNCFINWRLAMLNIRREEFLQQFYTVVVVAKWRGAKQQETRAAMVKGQITLNFKEVNNC